MNRRTPQKSLTPMKKSWVVQQRVKVFTLSNFGQLFGQFIRLNGSRPICTEVLFSNKSEFRLRAEFH